MRRPRYDGIAGWYEPGLRRLRTRRRLERRAPPTAARAFTPSFCREPQIVRTGSGGGRPSTQFSVRSIQTPAPRIARIGGTCGPSSGREWSSDRIIPRRWDGSRSPGSAGSTARASSSRALRMRFGSRPATNSATDRPPRRRLGASRSSHPRSSPRCHDSPSHRWRTRSSSPRETTRAGRRPRRCG